MALKAKLIGYTNSSGSTKTLTITGATYLKFSVNAAADIYTDSQTVANKQTIASGTEIEMTTHGTKQHSADVVEDINIEVPNTNILTGYIVGQSASWSVA